MRRRRLILTIEGVLLLLCLVYCLVAPSQYEAAARVELRTSSVSSLNLGTAENLATASVLSAHSGQACQEAHSEKVPKAG